jgi:hypothetical protein
MPLFHLGAPQIGAAGLTNIAANFLTRSIFTGGLRKEIRAGVIPGECLIPKAAGPANDIEPFARVVGADGCLSAPTTQVSFASTNRYLLSRRPPKPPHFPLLK